MTDIDLDELEEIDLGNLSAQLVMRAGHLPSCGDTAEFPWDCTCDYGGFMDTMGRLLDPATVSELIRLARLGAGLDADRLADALWAWGFDATGPVIRDDVKEPTDSQRRMARKLANAYNNGAALSLTEPAKEPR